MDSVLQDLKNVPGPKGLDGFRIVGRIREVGILGMMQELSEKHGEWVKLTSPGGPPMFLISSIEDIYSILVTHTQSFVKGRSTDMFRLVIGKSLPIVEGEIWLGQRRMLQPLFHRQLLVGYLDLMKKATVEHASRWLQDEAKAPDRPVDLHHLVSELTHDIVARSLFGFELGAEFGHLGEAWTDALDFVVKRVSSVVRLPLHYPLPSHRKFHKTMEQINRTVDAIISKRVDSGITTGNDMLSRLIKARHEGEKSSPESLLSNQDIRDQILAFLFAGHETTASNISWTLYLLLKNPAILKDVREEIQRVFPPGRELTLESLAELDLLRRVIYESLRLFSPAALFLRESHQDVVIGNKKLPKGTVLMISPYIVHRKPELWPDPHKFDPERFKDVTKKPGAQKYIAFGLGPRVCIGEQFAVAEAQVVLMNLLMNLDLKLFEEEKVKPNFNGTLRPQNIRTFLRPKPS